jgi:DNA-binding transcriptional ArsR family regulator
LVDPTRREILERIAASPSSVSQLADRLPVSQPAVSQHLKVLREADLVSVRKEGRARVYSLKSDGLAALRAYLDRFWGDVLDSFAEGIEVDQRDDAT